MPMKRRIPSAILAPSLLALSGSAWAQTVQLPFNASYTVTTVGAVPGVPLSYGGLTFKANDSSKLLIAGAA